MGAHCKLETQIGPNDLQIATGQIIRPCKGAQLISYMVALPLIFTTLNWLKYNQFMVDLLCFGGIRHEFSNIFSRAKINAKKTLKPPVFCCFLNLKINISSLLRGMFSSKNTCKHFLFCWNKKSHRGRT